MTFLEQVGRSAIGYAEDAGALTIQFWTVLRKLPRVLPVLGKRRRWQSAVQQMFAIGASALPMSGIMSLCTGFILALQSASELRRFGALQFVVDLVAIGFTRELGPLITALAVSGRSASAISAEIGTMVVTEEVDALRVMGLDPVEFTLAPKVPGRLDHTAVPHDFEHSLRDLRRVPLPGLQHRHEPSGVLPGGCRIGFAAGHRALARQERGFRDHHRPGWLPGRPARARRSRSRRPFCNDRGGEIDFPRDSRGPRRYGDLLPDGMECRRMTSLSAPNNVDPMISIRDVSMSYGSRRVLDRVDLDVHRGEILVLLGGSGSGKTTLLKHVLGLTKPDTGSIRISGVDITTCSPSELASVRRRIGVAFQAGALFNSLSVADNVALPLQELTHLADSTIELMVWMKLKAVGLSDAARLYPPELSGGMRKRAAVARAMALDPELLIFDEPSAGLDPIVAAGLDELILFLKHTLRITILVVTHELESAFRIADRLAMLHQGRLIAVGTKEQFSGNVHPRIRQFLDRQPDAVAAEGAGAFIASYLSGVAT